MQSKDVQHRGELHTGFAPLSDRRRGRNDSRPRKQTNLVFMQSGAADRHHPLAVAFGVAPANDAAKKFAVKRLQFGNQPFRRLMREAAQRGGRMQQAGQRQGIFPGVGFAFERRAEVPQRRGVISCGESGSCRSLLRSRSTAFIAWVTSSCS